MGDVEKEYLEQEEYFHASLPRIYDPETGWVYPVMQHRFKPYIDALQVWMERENFIPRP